MTRTLLLLFVGPAVGVAAPIRSGSGPDKPSEIEGKWVVTEATANGGVAQARMVGASISISGGRFSMESLDGASRGRLTIEAGANPKRMEFRPVGTDGKPSDNKGRWIYEVTGNELRMASFTDSGGSIPEKIDLTDRTQLVWMLKRVKD